MNSKNSHHQSSDNRMIWKLRADTDQLVISKRFLIKSRNRLEKMVQKGRQPSGKLSPFWKLALAAFIALVLLSAGVKATEVLAEKAKPGSFLYKIDRIIKTVKLNLSTDPIQKKRLQREIIEKQLWKVETVEETKEQILQEIDESLEEQQEELNEMRKKFIELKEDGLTATESRELRQELKEKGEVGQLETSTRKSTPTPTEKVVPSLKPTTTIKEEVIKEERVLEESKNPTQKPTPTTGVVPTVKPTAAINKDIQKISPAPSVASPAAKTISQ